MGIGIMVYSLLWVMQDLYHQPFEGVEPLGFRVFPTDGGMCIGLGRDDRGSPQAQ